MFRNSLLFTLLLVAFLGPDSVVNAQVAFNTTLRDNITFSSELNDVWGYVAPDGTEYALVGRVDGVSIVSLADPDNLVEVASIPGGASTWRDLKSFGEYAYIVADRQQEGITVIDLSELPVSVSFERFVTGNTPIGDLVQAHNIFIDETTGLAYIAGESGPNGRLNGGGMVIYDVATTPGTPIFVAFAPSVYAHDVYVQDGIMYASEINDGDLTLYDVSDSQNITELATTQTPFNFTHNAWTDATGTYVYTTDERPNASVAAYDISDLLDIRLLDEFRPARSLGSGTIPHNVHVTADDYLVISGYTDGIEIVDASVPGNLVEVGFYDHWSGNDGGFNGSWGAYPFLPSGLVLSSDISNGLFVIEVDYQRAARLRGLITDSDSGASLNNVSVSISSSNPTATQSAATGRYQSGIAEAGTFTVTYSLAGYNSQSVQVNFISGVETVQDIQLVQKVAVAFGGDVTSAEDGGAIAGATVLLQGEDGEAEDISDNSGNVFFNAVFTGMYQAYAGIWGFQDAEQPLDVATSGNIVSFELEPGFRDGFAVDQGWTVSGDAATGIWERGIPVGTFFGDDGANPGEDAMGDIGNTAYVTGNGGGGAGTDDVDGGTTTITSPVFNLTQVGDNDAMISYRYWWYNAGGNGTPDDEMTVAVFNGTSREVIRTYDNNSATQSAWTADNFNLSDLSIPLTATMQVEVSAGDIDTGGGHLVEAGFDDFVIVGLSTLPFRLTAFTAEAAGKQSALLQWTTTAEINGSHFDLQRSTDGRGFVTAGRVEARGQATGTLAYTFVDNEALPGDNYYRLVMTDLDGSFAFSETRLVTLTGQEAGILAYPNPAGDFLNFTAPFTGSIRVYDATGRELIQQTNVDNGRLNVRQLLPGQYWVKVGGETVPFTKR